MIPFQVYLKDLKTNYTFSLFLKKEYAQRTVVMAFESLCSSTPAGVDGLHVPHGFICQEYTTKSHA